MSSLPSGVRLVALLNEHLSDIMSRERTNTASIHLYCTGPYWVAFDRETSSSPNQRLLFGSRREAFFGFQCGYAKERSEDRK